MAIEIVDVPMKNGDVRDWGMVQMTLFYRIRQNYGKKKKRFNLQAPPVYDRKVTNLFFSIIIFSIIMFFFHNSVGAIMSIDSQFECILRGNIEL